MSSTDQNDVDALLAQVEARANAVEANAGAAPAEATAALDQAATSVAEIAGEMESPAAKPGAQAAMPVQEVSESASAPTAVGAASDVGRLLAIEVPVIVQLGVRKLTVGEVMRLAVGAIVEFGKSAEEELDLLANNKPIGKGHAVKVGENFGIKVTSIGTVKETIRKLGS